MTAPVMLDVTVRAAWGRGGWKDYGMKFPEWAAYISVDEHDGIGSPMITSARPIDEAEAQEISRRWFEAMRSGHSAVLADSLSVRLVAPSRAYGDTWLAAVLNAIRLYVLGMVD